MISAVADTHSIIWYLANDIRLSEKARTTFESAVQSGRGIGVPSICPVEIIYLVEKGRVNASHRDQLMTALGTETSPLKVLALDESIAWRLSEIDRAVVPDMPDRIIAATALHFQVPLISRDRKITASQVTTVW